MATSKDSLKKIIEFQNSLCKRMKRPVSYSEALALWMTQISAMDGRAVKNKKQVLVEPLIY
ncbi:MAG: hypothetical protein Kow0037_11930 [Calditrichia bacterium]